MTFLNLDNRMGDTESIVQRLNREQKTLSITGLGLEEVDVDETILQALVDFLREYHVQGSAMQNQFKDVHSQRPEYATTIVSFATVSSKTLHM
jgi:hypothetical protein